MPRWLLALALAIVAVACSREGEMRAVASKDLACPEDAIRVVEVRADIEEPTWEITACGHLARYTCHIRDRTSHDPERHRGICKQDVEYPSKVYTPED